MQKLLLALSLTSGLIASVSATEITCSSSLPVAELITTMGVIDIQLNPAKAPASVANFIRYVKSGFYKDKIFHRVIPGFMIQGGGFDQAMHQAATKAAIQNEADNGLPNDKYSIALARTSDPQSATAQFFINLKDNNFLNFSSKTKQGFGYAVFGKVVKGNEIVDKIAAVATTSAGENQDVPVKPVVIKSATMLVCK